MGSPLFDIRKSHLLITELLTNFGRKTEELNRLKTSIDIAWNEIRVDLSFFWVWVFFGYLHGPYCMLHTVCIILYGPKSFINQATEKKNSFLALAS